MKVQDRLTAGGLLKLLRSGFEKIEEHRVAELVKVSLPDTLMSAFAMFSLKDPFAPEPIIKQDGETKNDCERNAAKRFLAQLRQDHPDLPLIVTEDALSSNAPHIRELEKHNLHYILGVKEGDHPGAAVWLSG